MSKKAELSQLMSAIMNKFVVAYSNILDNDTSASQYYILEILAKEGAKKSSDLAERLNVSLPAITNLAKKLVRKGYIERIVPQEDRRITMLQITPSGAKNRAMFDERYDILTGTLWDQFSDQEIDQLVDYLNRMKKNLDHRIK